MVLGASDSELRTPQDQLAEVPDRVDRDSDTLQDRGSLPGTERVTRFLARHPSHLMCGIGDQP